MDALEKSFSNRSIHNWLVPVIQAIIARSKALILAVKQQAVVTLSQQAHQTPRNLAHITTHFYDAKIIYYYDKT